MLHVLGSFLVNTLEESCTEIGTKLEITTYKQRFEQTLVRVCV
jgi:hypothetical protein